MTNLQEIWRPIQDYKGLYEISNLGNVKSLSRLIKKNDKVVYALKEKILRLTINQYGYVTVLLTRDKKEKRFRVHRLVAEAFLQEDPIKTIVNHKDRNRSNNHASNLEWCTQKENVMHSLLMSNRHIKIKKYTDKSTLRGLHMKGRINNSLSKIIIQFNSEKEEIKRWPSVAEVNRVLGFSKYSLFKYMKGNSQFKKTFKGFYWNYLD